MLTVIHIPVKQKSLLRDDITLVEKVCVFKQTELLYQTVLLANSRQFCCSLVIHKGNNELYFGYPEQLKLPPFKVKLSL